MGDYRVIYQIVDTAINILVIQHRKDCYNNS
ncbi:type II toxin-antitoxin system RelE family toxin [Candidatus Tisiphia endosymbiont of Myopa tessellatipennis]